MELTYIYHSGFALKYKSFSIIIDYFKEPFSSFETEWVHSQLLNYSGRLYVLSSHSHPDHFCPEIFNWKKEKEDIRYLLSKDILDVEKSKRTKVIYLDKLDVYEDDLIRVKAYGSTDIGVSFLIEAEGKRYFHAGDLNNWHWNEECSEEESAGYESSFLKEVELIAKEVNHIDLAIFPIDPRLGKDYMRGAEQFISRIPTNIFSPMHFDNEYQKAAAFASFARIKKCKVIKWNHKGDCYTL
ncbi:MBL fold metallo-hydrolase [Bacteroides sedimenti]|uniref:Hydrolase n=1 Tax=Bacteroides sedimenti TaxID=2136147 RepID=A0ABM8IBG6_9BACE